MLLVLNSSLKKDLVPQNQSYYLSAFPRALKKPEVLNSLTLSPSPTIKFYMFPTTRMMDSKLPSISQPYRFRTAGNCRFAGEIHS